LKCQFSDSNNNIQNWNVHFQSEVIIFRIEILILSIQNNNLEFKFQLSKQIISLKFNSKFKIDISIFIVKDKYSKSECQFWGSNVIFNWNYNFLIQNNNLKFKHHILHHISFFWIKNRIRIESQFSDSYNNIQNWNAHF